MEAHLPCKEFLWPLVDAVGIGLKRAEIARTSADVDIQNVVGYVLVFEAPNREVVEKFHANDPYTLEDMFEIAIIKPLWQRVPALD